MCRKAFGLCYCVFLLAVSEVKGIEADKSPCSKLPTVNGILIHKSGHENFSAWSSRKNAHGRQLKQSEEEGVSSYCSLSDSVVDEYFNANDNAWTVTSELLNEMDGELQPVVECASTGATIVISSGLQIEITDRVSIRRGITIRGEGNDEDDYPTLTCPENNQIFNIRDADNLVLRRLRIVNCNPDGDNSPMEIEDSEVTIDDCHFRGNRGTNGGVIEVEEGARVTIRDCTFINNVAVIGGAIAFQPQSRGSVINSTFRNNEAPNGGALYLNNDTVVETEGSTFAENRAFQFGGAIYIHAEQARVFLNWNTFATKLEFEMRDCRCINNEAPNGGCIAMHNESNLIVERTVFEKNTVTGQGGAIYALRVTQVVLNDLTFRMNKALTGGAMFFNSTLIEEPPLLIRSIGRANVIMKNCTFQSNTARFGGAIAGVDAVSLELTDGLFESNVADGERALIGNGGAVLLYGSQSYDRNGSFNSILGDATIGQGGQRANVFRRDGLRSIRANIEMSDTLAIPMVTIKLENVNFTNNSATGFAGAIDCERGCGAAAEDVTFENNSADHVGAVYAFQSIFFCERCQFRSNSVVQSGGAVVVQGVPGSDITGVTLAEGYFREVVFENNTAGYYGGALLVDGLSAFLYILGNVNFTDNEASGGGAISYELAVVMNITNARIENNRATLGGGAIAMTFVQFRTNSVTMRNIEIRNNSAPIGGGIQALYNVQTADIERPRIEFGGSTVSPSLTMENATVEDNNATEGGGMFLDGVPGLLVNVTIRANSAIRRGGGLTIQDGSVVKVIDGSFLSNEGDDGGGIMSDEGAALHGVDCRMEENVARENGGGICVTTRLYEQQPVAFQCDRCHFRANNGTKGGGLHASHGNMYIAPMEDSVIVLRGVEFEDNVARVGGGAIMARHPQNIHFSCAYNITNRDRQTRSIHARFLQRDTLEKLDNLKTAIPCDSWKDNRVLPGGYGRTKASYALYGSIKYEGSDINQSTNSVSIIRTEHGPRLPTLQVVLFDEFEQSPAEPRIENQNSVVSISVEHGDLELSGQLNAPFIRGISVFDAVSIRATPGMYILKFAFSDSNIESLLLHVKVDPCPIGWKSIANNTNCSPCEIETYNFIPDESNCRLCPDHGVFRSWGIEPQKNYWQPFPCYENPTECLLEDSCTYDGREKTIKKFIRETNATCHLEAQDLDEWRSIQCNAGHRGLLCGSCKPDYGRRGLQCRRCHSKALVSFLLVLLLLWFIFIVTIAAKGNLSGPHLRTNIGLDARIGSVEISDHSERTFPIQCPNEESKNNRYMKRFIELGPVGISESIRTQLERQYPNTSTSGTPGRFEGDRDTRDAEQSSSTEHGLPREQAMMTKASVTPSHQADTQQAHGGSLRDAINRYELARRTIAETFKVRYAGGILGFLVFFCVQLFINYAQVTTMALSINVNWTDGVRKSLQSLDFLGVLAGEAAVSLDCLFSETSTVPRSISSEILFLIIPFVMLMLCMVYWARMLRMSPTVRNRRFMLSAVIILYISYIGITRRLIRILYCVKFKDGTSPDDIFEDRYWTEDTSVRCYTGSHAWLVGLLVMPLIAIVSIAFPIGSAYILSKRRYANTLHTDVNRETFGFMFRGYRDAYVYWDSVIMLRKALLALVVGLGYPLGPNLQGNITLFILFISVISQAYLHPFADSYAFLNHLETFSLGASTFVYIAGAMLNERDMPGGYRLFISLCLLGFSLAFVFLCFGYMFVKGIELMRSEMERDGIPLKDKEICGSIVYLWMKHRCRKVYHQFTEKEPLNNNTTNSLQL